MLAAEVVSPLSGECAIVCDCGPADDRAAWVLIREWDGTSFVVRRTWLCTALLCPLAPADREQLLICARYFARDRKTLVVLGPDDVSFYELHRSSLRVTNTHPWFVRGFHETVKPTTAYLA